MSRNRELQSSKTRVVNDIGGRDMSLSKNVERHHCLRHVEMSSDIFKNVDKNVDVENVEIFWALMVMKKKIYLKKPFQH